MLCFCCLYDLKQKKLVFLNCKNNLQMYLAHVPCTYCAPTVRTVRPLNPFRCAYCAPTVPTVRQISANVLQPTSCFHFTKSPKQNVKHTRAPNCCFRRYGTFKPFVPLLYKIYEQTSKPVPSFFFNRKDVGNDCFVCFTKVIKQNKSRSVFQI